MRADKYRKHRAEKAKQEPTAEVKLPSGEVFTLRRPPLHIWVSTGKIPQHFIRQARKLIDAPEGAQPTDDEALNALKFMGDIVRYACVSPRIKEDPGPDEDAIDPSEFIEGDFEFIFQWATNQAPDVPVLTEGGQTSVEALESFRDEGRGGGTAGHRPNGAEVWAATEPAATPV